MKLRAFRLGVFLWVALALPSLRADDPVLTLQRAPFLTVPYPLEYPGTLQDTHSPGSVTMILYVNERGRVTKVEVLNATHPDFVAAALTASHKWVFEPTFVNGKAQPVRFGFTATFVVENWLRNDAADHSFGFTLLPANAIAQRKVFDSFPNVWAAVNPVYPYELALAGIRGRAEVVYDIDAQGRITAMEVVSSPQPEFVASLKALGDACRFSGGFKDHKAVGFQVRRRQDFGPGEDFSNYHARTKKLVELLRAGGTGIASLQDLDARIAPLYQPGPAYPTSLLAAKATGSAEIEFFVDPDGKAQLPRIVSASQPEFGWAAATAVQQWFFDQPRQNGKPVYVRMHVPMDFKVPQ
jgi:TonB family protein